jgi:hypothetical protein
MTHELLYMRTRGVPHTVIVVNSLTRPKTQLGHIADKQPSQKRETELRGFIIMDIQKKR